MANPKRGQLRRRPGPVLAVGAAAALLGLHSDSSPSTLGTVSPQLVTRGTPGHSKAFARVDLRELAALPQTPPLARLEEDEREEQIRPPKLPLPRDARLRLEPRHLRTEATSAARVASPPLATSFQALADNGMVFPPDTEGTIGPNHVVTTL